MKKTITPTIEAPAEASHRKKKTSLAPRARAQAKPSNGAGTNGEHNSELESGKVLTALVALKKGDFEVRLPISWTGIGGKVADTFNELAEMMGQSTAELSRVSRLVGQEGKIQERLVLGGVTGAWSERVKS